MKIILINGYPQSGKDTFVELCQKHANVENILTSTPSKEALKLLGWDGEKTARDRAFIAQLMEFSEHAYRGVERYLKECVSAASISQTTEVMFIHVREPQNLDKYKEMFDASTMFVRRDSVKYARHSNKSDAEVELYEYDWIIHNNDTIENLEKAALRFLEEIRKGLLH